MLKWAPHTFPSNLRQKPAGTRDGVDAILVEMCRNVAMNLTYSVPEALFDLVGSHQRYVECNFGGSRSAVTRT